MMNVLLSGIAAVYVSAVMVLSMYPHVPIWSTVLLVPLAFYAISRLNSRLVQGRGIMILQCEESIAPRQMFIRSVIFAVVVLSVYFIVWRMFMPDWFPGDAQTQWRQVQTGDYNDWHPFAHTFLMMKVPSLIWNDPRVLVLWLMLWMAIGIGYMGATLARIGISQRWIYFALSVALLHPLTYLFTTGPLKDTAFAIAAMFGAAELMEAAHTRLVSLRSFRSTVILVISLCLVLAFRKNGIFLVGPIIVGLFVCGWNRHRGRVLTIVVGMIALFVALNCVLYAIYDVKPGSNFPRTHVFMESAGMPLTMMGAVYVRHPDAIPVESRALLESVAPCEKWLSCYQVGSFGTVKYGAMVIFPTYDPDAYGVIKFDGWMSFFPVFVQTVLVDTSAAIEAFVKLTEQVWCPWGIAEGSLDYVKKLLKLDTATWFIPLVKVFYVPVLGLTAIVLLMVMVLLQYVWRCHKCCFFLWWLPFLAYTFGTMLFLSGFNEYRYFYLTELTFIPWGVLLCVKTR